MYYVVECTFSLKLNIINSTLASTTCSCSRSYMFKTTTWNGLNMVKWKHHGWVYPMSHLAKTFPIHPILFDRHLESLLVPMFLYFYTLNLKCFPFTKFSCFKNFQWPRCLDFYCDLWHLSISSINYFDLGMV
jgi:hypothetical protein